MDNLEKGKKKRRIREHVHYLVDFRQPPSTGAHAIAQGHTEALRKPDVDKTTGNPLPNPYQGERSGSGSGRVAVNHPDLCQSSADFGSVLENLRTLRTARGNVVDLGVSDSTPGGFSHAGQVALRLFDAACMAGSYRGMQAVDPDPLRPADHFSRTSATADNGSHSCGSQQAACCTPPMSAKASDRLAIMKETQRRLA